MKWIIYILVFVFNLALFKYFNKDSKAIEQNNLEHYQQKKQNLNKVNVKSVIEEYISNDFFIDQNPYPFLNFSQKLNFKNKLIINFETSTNKICLLRHYSCGLPFI